MVTRVVPTNTPLLQLLAEGRVLPVKYHAIHKPARALLLHYSVTSTKTQWQISSTLLKTKLGSWGTGES